jgi:hypothetical protein
VLHRCAAACSGFDGYPDGIDPVRLKCEVFQLRCRVSLAHCNSPSQKSPFHRIAREGKRRAKVPARDFPFSAAKFKFAQCRSMKWIRGQAIAITDGLDLCESAFGTLILCDRGRAIERDDRRRIQCDQGILPMTRQMTTQRQATMIPISPEAHRSRRVFRTHQRL